ncbi:MAG: cytochrome c3 family protein [Nitrospirota bacterium]|nr:cytochrome c3 family protein [Nitrospirota bacterium]
MTKLRKLLLVPALGAVLAIALLYGAPVVQAQDAPPAEAAAASDEDFFQSLIDPRQAIWMDSRGVIAGTGDPNGFAGEAFKMGQGAHPEALELSNLPTDVYGLVDWARAIREGYVTPRHSLDPAKQDKPDDKPFGLALLIPAKSETMPDVIFPHDIHTMWLTCNNCHPEIFAMNGAMNNKVMTMPKIAAGEYCGRCHNRIAFPLSDCNRCHVHDKASGAPEGVKVPADYVP